jgi:hypothetical protein
MRRVSAGVLDKVADNIAGRLASACPDIEATQLFPADQVANVVAAQVSRQVSANMALSNIIVYRKPGSTGGSQ